MNIAIIGTGYVGLVTGTCFSEMGNNVACIDIDENKIQKLKNGIIPIFEPGLDDMILRNVEAQRLHFSTDITEYLDKIEVLFCAVGTPPDEDGSADLSYVLAVARTVGKNLKKHIVFTTKSTVPVGTAKKVRKTIQDELDKRGVDIDFDVASNPEFLKEGTAVKDFMTPERVVIGVESKKAQNIMKRLYHPFTLNNRPILIMDVPSAEMTKYAANAMLATRISFMNDIANLCERIGANVDCVRQGIGSDSRIGSKFLYAGSGYGGSCFPKDVKALMHTGIENGYHMRVIEAVETVNQSQKEVLFNKIKEALNDDVKGKTIALWGLAFKPDTDDMRESTALVVIQKLLEEGAIIKVYDPVAIDECRRRIGDVVEYAKDIYDAATNADAIALVTEWKQFRMPNWKRIRKMMKQPIVIDGRNIYDMNELHDAGFSYSCIGKKIYKLEG
jgi:UDPglucose 6-dehydrogenase